MQALFPLPSRNLPPSHLPRCLGGGGVVSALDSRSRGPDSTPGQVIVFFSITVPPSTQDYKWVRANCLGLEAWWNIGRLLVMDYTYCMYLYSSIQKE